MAKLTSPRRTREQASLKRLRNAYRRALKNSITEISEVIRRESERQLYENDLVATGDLLDSLETNFVEVDAFGFQVNIGYLDDAAVYVEDGRGGTGKQEGVFEYHVPITEIVRWVQARGIDERAVFPIARKITEEGFYSPGSKGKHPFEKAVERAEAEVEEILEKNLRKISDDAPSVPTRIGFKGK